MRHCSTENYYPWQPGYTTPKARRMPLVFREDALRHHHERLPEWIPWGSEFTTTGHYNAGPGLVVVTRCTKGHLTTVIHTTQEPYPRP